MTKTTKLLFAITLFALPTATFSQNFGIKCGMNLSTIYEEYNGNVYNGDYKKGFHIGGTAEFPISGMTVLETGLLLSTKGYVSGGTEMNIGEPIYNIKHTTNLYYLDIPFNVKRYINIGKTKIYGTIGPYIGLGLFGTNKSEFSSSTGETKPTESYNINWGNSNDDSTRRLDFGLTAGAGIVIKSIQIGLSYNFGLANTSPYKGNLGIVGGSPNTVLRVNNRVFELSIAYRFEKN